MLGIWRKKIVASSKREEKTWQKNWAKSLIHTLNGTFKRLHYIRWVEASRWWAKRTGSSRHFYYLLSYWDFFYYLRFYLCVFELKSILAIKCQWNTLKSTNLFRNNYTQRLLAPTKKKTNLFGNFFRIFFFFLVNNNKFSWMEKKLQLHLFF